MKILFQGDSVTDAGRTSVNGENLGRGYPLFVAGTLRSQYPDKGFEVVNRGISGDVVEGVRQRLDEIIPDNPSKIYLITGTNDLINEPELSAVGLWDRYEKLIKDIRDNLPGTTLYVQSMLPLNPKTKFYEGFNERAAELNKLIEAAHERYDYIYLDIASRLTDENGDLNAEYTTDGIHLSAAGYFVWAAELAKGSRMMTQF